MRPDDPTTKRVDETGAMGRPLAMPAVRPTRDTPSPPGQAHEKQPLFKRLVIVLPLACLFMLVAALLLFGGVAIAEARVLFASLNPCWRPC